MMTFRRRPPRLDKGVRPTAGAVRRPVAPEQAALLENLSRQIATRTWYLAETPPQKEPLAVRLLLDRGVAAFYPTRDVPVRGALARRAQSRQDRAAGKEPPKTRRVSALPGYVLVGVDAAGDAWRWISDCPALKGVVGSVDARTGERRPTPLRTRWRCRETGLMVPIPPCPETGRPRCPVTWMAMLSSDEAAVAEFAAAERRVDIGDVVEIHVGPWAEVRCKVVAIEGRAARLVGSFLGAEREMVADLWDVRRVE